MFAESAPQGVDSADSFVRSLLGSLLVTGTFRLALAAGGQETEQAAVVERTGPQNEAELVPSRNRAAGKFRSAALTMIRWSTCCRVLSSQNS